MDHNAAHSTGNAKVDGGLLLLIAGAGLYSKLTMSNVAAMFTIIGAILYCINQGYILSNNLKKKKANERLHKKNKQN